MHMDLEESTENVYTMGRLITGSRNKKNISLKELSQGILSVADLKRLEEDDEYGDKTTWDFLLGRLGISPLIYECYVEQEEYDLFQKRKEMRKISNEIMKIRYQMDDGTDSDNADVSAKQPDTECTEQLRHLAAQLEILCQEYTGLLRKVQNQTTAIHRLFLANMNGYVIQAKQQESLSDALKISMESEWEQFYSENVFSWIQKPHNVLPAVYEQELLFLLAQGYKENGETDNAIQILTWLWNQRRQKSDPEEKTRILPFAAWKLSDLEWSRKRHKKAMKICQEAIDLSIQTESFRGLLPLLKQQLFFQKQLNENQEDWEEQKKTIDVIDELFEEFQVNPYGLFVLTTFENARIADEIIRIRRKNHKLTQVKLSEGILEPESYSRFECGKRNLRWSKKKKLLERLGERGNKVSLLLESDDPDIVEEYQRAMDNLYRKKYDIVKAEIYELNKKLNYRSKINIQFLEYININMDIWYFQTDNLKKMYERRQEAIRETVPKYDEDFISEHCWSRTETAMIKGIADYYRQTGEPEKGIAMMRKAIESYNEDTIGSQNVCLGEQLLWETIAIYLGDILEYEEAIQYAKKGIKVIMESGSAKGVGTELYEIVWNEKEKGQAVPEIYRKKYLQALNLSVLFQDREFILFLRNRNSKYLGEKQ